MPSPKTRGAFSRSKQWLYASASRLVTACAGDDHGRVLLSVLRGPARGLRFRLDLVSGAETGYFLGRYDPEILRQIEKICQPGWRVWDCGGYIGFYTAFFAKLAGPKGSVVVFEPDPRNMARIKSNMQLNKFEQVQFVPAAIGAPCTEVDFVLSGNTNSHISGAYVGATPQEYAEIERVIQHIKVPCLSLDEACYDKGLPRPQLIKLDIDGAEMIALQHVERLAREVRPMIILELHNPECDRAAWDFACRTNYSLRSLNTGQRIQTPEQVGGTLLCTPEE